MDKLKVHITKVYEKELDESGSYVSQSLDM